MQRRKVERCGTTIRGASRTQHYGKEKEGEEIKEVSPLTLGARKLFRASSRKKNRPAMGGFSFRTYLNKNRHSTIVTAAASIRSENPRNGGRRAGGTATDVSKV